MHAPSPTVLSLLLGAALLTMGNALLGTLVSVRMGIEGFPRLLSGMVMSAYFAGFVLGSIYAFRIIDRVGHIRAFATFAAMVGAAATAQALIVSPLPWIVLRATVGFAIAGKLIVSESWLNSAARADNRGRAFSLYMIAIYLAFGGGQFALVLGDPAGSELFLVVTFLLSASILPIVLTRAAAPRTPPTTRMRIRHVYEIAPLGLAGAFVAGLSVGAVQSIGPQFAGELGFSVTRISWFMGAFFLSGILFQWPAGHLSDFVDRRSVLGAMALLAAVAFGAIAVVEDRSFALLIGLAILGGGAAATLYPLSVAHANDRLRGESVVAITASLLLANGIGAIAGPILATGVMLAVGAPGLFVAAAVPCVALAGHAGFRMLTYARVAQDPYETMAQTTPAVLELDPRAQR